MNWKFPFYLSVGTKLLSGVVFIVIILGVFGLYLSNTAESVRASFTELDARYSALKEISSIENIHSIQSDATKSYVLTRDEKWVDIYDSASLEFDLRVEELQELLAETSRGEALDEFVQVSDQLRATELLVLAKVREGDIARAEEIISGEYPDLQIQSLNTLASLRTEMDLAVSELIQQNRVLLLFTENILISFIVVLIILITIVSMAISFSVSSSIRELGETVEAINGGDLSKRARVRTRDEIGRLAMAFNKMTQRLEDSYAGLEQKVATKTSLLQKNVGELERSKRALIDVMEDLAEEKDQLAVSKARDDAILESIGDGMLVLNEQGGIQFLNESAAQALQCGPKKCLGKTVDMIVTVIGPEGKEVRKEDQPCFKVLEHGMKMSTSEYSFRRANGEVVPVAMTATPIIFNGNSIGAVVIFRDITHEKEVDRAKTEFVSLASHQLRGPLTSMKWNAELLLEDKGLSEEQRGALSDLLTSNDHMIELVNKMLNISRIEKGNYIVDPVSTDLREIVNSILYDYQAQITERSLTVIKDFPKVFAQINVDPNLTRIMYQNLISNAVKYSRRGGEIRLSFYQADGQVVFSVKDSGIGIPKKEQSHIFEKMFRASNAVDAEEHGNGLGLYMVKEIAERSGGAIWFESAEDKGTTFFVSIPVSGMKSRKGTKSLT